MGIDPVTHKPKSDTSFSSASDGQSKSIANVSHMAQWESARLEAEARLARESKLRAPPPPSAIRLPHQLDHMMRGAWQGGWQPKCTRIGQRSSPHNNNNNTIQQINLQSPTSTLSFSEQIPSMASLVDPNPPIFMCCSQEGDHKLERSHLQGDQEGEGGLKCFDKPIRLTVNGSSPSTAAVGAGGAYSINNTTMYRPTSLFSSTEESWLAESSSIRSGSSRCSGGEFGPAAGSLFTEMLLDNCDDRNSSERGGAGGDSDNPEESMGCMEEEEEEVEEEEEEEENDDDDDDDDNDDNNYWNNMLDLVNLSSTPSNSPPTVF